MSESAELVIDGEGPIGQQIESQIRRFVLDGILAPGEELPTIRAVAVGLAVNPHAVEQAYNRLERGGWLTQAEGSGSRVAAPPDSQSDPELKRQCEVFLRWAAQSGYSLAAVLHTLTECSQGEIRHDQA